MKNGIFLLIFLFVWSACSVEDKGNYDYTPQNEVIVTFNKEEVDRTLEKGMDTLFIHPEVTGDIYGENEENYEYKWFFCSGKEHRHTVVGTGKDLVWPVTFKPGNYTLYFQVIDKSTGLEWIQSTSVSVYSELTRGWLLLGETADREARLDMVVWKPDDSMVLVENIFENADHLKNPSGMIFSGYRASGKDATHLWLMTEEKDLKLTWGNKFVPVGEFYETMIVEETDVSMEVPRIRDMFPRQNASLGMANTKRNHSSRGVVTDHAVYMTTIALVDGSEVYVSPINHYSTSSKEYFKPYPMAFVLLGTRYLGNLYPLFYDMDEECFVRPAGLYGGYNTYCVKLTDYAGDKFPWNQKEKNRTIVYGENLFNSPSDYQCDCAALMKDKEGKDVNYYIYRFRPGAKTPFNTIAEPTKVNGYTIDKTVAVDFDKATHYAFLSGGYVLLYSVGSTLYAYNYSYNTLTSMEVDADISCVHTDIIYGGKYFWLATYDEGSQKGELKMVMCGGNQTPELVHDENDVWPLTMKVLDVEWKYGEDPAEEEPEEEENK